eukprot:2029975-Prymnesium_polylepis.1
MFVWGRGCASIERRRGIEALRRTQKMAEAVVAVERVVVGHKGRVVLRWGRAHGVGGCGRVWE